MDEKQKICYFDCETQGLNLLTDNKLWELGWIVVQNNKILEQHSYYLRWENFYLAPYLVNKLHFDREKYEKEAKDPKEVLDIFEKYLYSNEYIISGFNILNFDVYIVNQLQKLCGKKTNYSYIPRVLDIHALYKMYLLDIPYNKKEDNLLALQYKVLSILKKGVKTGIDAAAKNLQLSAPDEFRHTAIFDCLITNEIWNKIKYKLNL